MCLEIYELDLAKVISVPGLAWHVALKKAKVKLDLLTDIDMLLMVEKGIRGGIFYSIYQYAKTNNKYMKYYDKTKELSYIQYWDVNNLYGCSMSQKLPVNNFEWIEDTSQFNEDFIKNCNEQSDNEYFLEVDVQYLDKLQVLSQQKKEETICVRTKLSYSKVFHRKFVNNKNEKTRYL